MDWILDNMGGNSEARSIDCEKSSIIILEKRMTLSYSVNISNVSGSSKQLTETGLYISLLYIPRCWLVAPGDRWPRVTGGIIIDDESVRMVVSAEWRQLEAMKEWWCQWNGGVDTMMEESIQWCWSLDMSMSIAISSLKGMSYVEPSGSLVLH